MTDRLLCTFSRYTSLGTVERKATPRTGDRSYGLMPFKVQSLRVARPCAILLTLALLFSAAPALRAAGPPRSVGAGLKPAPTSFAPGFRAAVRPPQQAEPRTGRYGAEAKLRVNVNLVLVDVTVKDKHGQIIDGLTKDDFVVSDDGVEEQIAHFSRYQLPLAVALVVDLSGSIMPFLRPLRYATTTALRSLKPEDQVALFAFTDRVDRLVDLTGDKQRVADQIAAFSAGGSTNINGALDAAANYLRGQAPQARSDFGPRRVGAIGVQGSDRVIILVSDNVPTASTVSSDQALNAMFEADALLYGLKIPGDNPWQARFDAKLHKGRLGNVAQMAESTGGEIFDVQKEGSLYIAFEALINRLKTRYTLGYYPTNPPGGRQGRKDRFRTLTVRLTPRWGKSGRDYVVLARRGYFPPGSRQ